MFVRLTLADVKEGEMDNALEYVKNTVMPSYDGIAGLLGIAACATNDGKFMAWSTWANEEAKNEGVNKKVEAKSEKKIGRNDKCPCGSGKKYKHCCGKY